MTTDGDETTEPGQPPRPTETKVYIRSLNITRGSEAERLRLTAGGLDVRLLYGPVSVEEVRPLDEATEVHFLVRLTLDSEWLSISAAFGGHHVFPGTHSNEEVKTDSFLRTIANGAAPYIQEIGAYLTGRLGITPLLLPLGGDQLVVLRVQEGSA